MSRCRPRRPSKRATVWCSRRARSASALCGTAHGSACPPNTCTRYRSVPVSMAPCSSWRMATSGSSPARTDRNRWGDTPAVPGATVFVTCSSTEDLARHESFTVWSEAAGRGASTRQDLDGAGHPCRRGSWRRRSAWHGSSWSPSAGALLMVLSGVLTPRSAVRGLDWNVLFILAGSVGLGAIVVDSGLADRLARVDRAGLRREHAHRRRGLRRDDDGG